MRIFLTILFGFVAGVVGGMGMGGGTFLIPLLSFLGYEQKVMQAMNLLSFLPMAAVALTFHFKNKLVKTGGVVWMILPALAFSVAGALLTQRTSPKFLRVCIAVFFFCMGAHEIFCGLKKIKDKKQ